MQKISYNKISYDYNKCRFLPRFAMILPRFDMPFCRDFATKTYIRKFICSFKHINLKEFLHKDINFLATTTRYTIMLLHHILAQISYNAILYNFTINHFKHINLNISTIGLLIVIFNSFNLTSILIVRPH